MHFLEWILSFFKSLPITGDTKPRELGALIDPRPLEEQKKDPQFAEIVTKAANVSWTKKDPATFRVFGSQDQSSSCSCVAHSGRKSLRVLFNVNHGLDLDFSAADIYRRRSNFPDQGMSGPDLVRITGDGVQLNALMPSDRLNEYGMNNPKILPGAQEVADYFRVPKWIILPTGDIEAIASVIQQTGKAPVLFQFFTDKEWSQYQPTIDAPHSLTEKDILRHGVCAVDFTLNEQGTKCLVIDDSAHFGGLDRRLLTEEVIRSRNYWAAYPMRFKFDPDTSSRPTFTDGNVVSLQDCLKYEAVFPSNVGSTGVYGSITSDAVKAFQAKYQLSITGLINPETRAKLHELFP